MHKTLVLLGWAVSFAIVGCAQAGFALTFDASNYTIATLNNTVQVQVYLEQTSPTTTLSNDGVSFAKFRIDLGTSSPTVNVASVGDVVINTGFDDFAITTFEPNGIVFDAASLTSIFPDVGDPNRILLGRFVFSALSSGTTTLSLIDLPESDNFLSGLLDSLDSQITFGATATINVAAVPEPSSIVLVCVGSLLGIAKKHRRRRRDCPR